MAIYKLIRNTIFEPKDIERLVAAYEQTLRALRLKDRDAPSRSLSPRRSLRLAGWELKTRLRFPSSHSKSWAGLGGAPAAPPVPLTCAPKGALLALDSHQQASPKRGRPAATNDGADRIETPTR